MKTDNKNKIPSPVTSEPKKISNPAKNVQAPKLPTKLTFCQDQNSGKPVAKGKSHKPKE